MSDIIKNIEIKFTEVCYVEMPMPLSGNMKKLKEDVIEVLNKKGLLGLKVEEKRISFEKMHEAISHTIINEFSRKDLIKIYGTLEDKNLDNEFRGKPKISNKGVIDLFEMIEDPEFEEKRMTGKLADLTSKSKRWLFKDFAYTQLTNAYSKKYPKLDIARKKAASEIFEKQVLPILEQV